MSKNNKQKQYIVVGLGRFGRAIAETLCQDGAEVLGVDCKMDMVERMRDELTQTIQMDAMDRDALETLGVQDFDIVFVTMGSDIRASGTIVLLLKELGARRVIAKAHDEFHGRMLEKLGADQVLFPERDMGRRVAHSLISGNVIEYMELSTRYSMAEIRPKPEWIGKTLKELAMRSSLDINVVAIRSGDAVNAMPQPETRISQGDVMLVVISENALKEMR
ncbi:MAG: TrkA family potassium uptake protein [Clostridia bacterium]|nr:TrkA family potassium uptake protein [Clostridia bacterium]MBQ3478389.1 TrkA family potassium uptake protein [Clostridia bacterium]MBQ6122540.1 TrkA family potassium uptake protein [Clostridia bacterium]MBQ6325272.1 TrkA family potassium uptake protein [Clostridia bacterium]MBQ8963108.1 TrkA family potassium uptake protein [Clostridia bacterium]